MNKPTVAGIRVTRNCNMMCPYCNIPNQPKENLKLEEWKQALSVIKRLGINNLVILGGEPTIYTELSQLIDYGVHELNLIISMTTNAKDNYSIIDKCIDSGLSRIGVSVDNLDYKKSISPLKCKYGLEMIDYIKKQHPNMIVVDYIVINKKNIDYIVSLIKELNSKNVISYILPYHWGNEGSFEHRKNKDIFAFTSKEDFKKYEKTILEIIELKKAGYLIDNSIEFLKNSIKHIEKLDWKCSGLYELRVDSDGQMVCCCDKFGNVNKKYSIFNLEEKYESFCRDQAKDAKTCNGCLWPSAFEAELKGKINK